MDGPPPESPAESPSPAVPSSILAERLSHIALRLKELKKPKTRLVAVTKTRPLADIRTLADLGQRDIGENRFGEARDKIVQFSAEAKEYSPVFHHIGPLQSGNARQIPRFFSWVHGVSDKKSLQILLKAALHWRDKAEKERNPAFARTWPMHYLFQIRLTKEKTKRGGMEPQEFLNLKSYPENDALRFSGLMTMGPQNNDSAESREVFSRLRELRDSNAPSALLSMGMSNDWEEAVSEGADIIRLGSLLFGPRPSI